MRSSVPNRWILIGAIVSLCAGVVRTASAQEATVSPVASDAVFAKVNGQAITWATYVHALERVNMGGKESTTNAERFCLDQLITNQIILAEAAKENVIPSDEAVNAYYAYQRKLFQETMPTGKDYETSEREQGTSPDETKANLKIQLAEMALYAKRMKVTDADIRKIYDKADGQFGLPARVLLRLIIVAPGSPDFTRARQMLDAGTDFAQVAKTVNVTQLRASSGLLPNYTMMNQIAEQLQLKVMKSHTGDVIGPIDYKYATDQPSAKAWVKIEDKRPPYNIAFDDAAPLIRQQLVQVQIQQPQFADIRNDIIKKKMDATFEPADARYATVWNSIKVSAIQAGVGQSVPITAPSPATPEAKPIPSPFKTTLIVTPTSVHSGDIVTLRFSVTNAATFGTTLYFGSGKFFDMTAASAKTGSIVWHASDGLMYTEALTNTSIAAGETKTFSATWTVGKSTPAGTYRLRAFLVAGDAETDDSRKILLPIEASASVTITSR